ncbi:hypothetical protein ACFV4E_15570 [Streptomyces hygroscopicus]|uniref:Uncharacterized protein n=1 Tax=Streptomyces demainii TaxID=588122 RepID=A0ABT9L7W8_9ACTN|nr:MULTISPECIES: hypothetical protein [Streptomyces]MDN3060090.1 hypothetical protein [Streptomyces sp. SRF1]MDP9616385.1 hypothetical protein [Streptomyces demainii]
MTEIDVLDETERESQLADQITGMLEDTAELVTEITALTPPSRLKFRLLSPKAWRAETMAYLDRETEAVFGRSAPSPEEATQSRDAGRAYRAGMLATWWMVEEGRTMLDSAGQPQTIIAPRALHHTGLRYASHQLFRSIVHDAVHQWQIASSDRAIMPIPVVPHDDPTVCYQGLVHLAEGHAEWATQAVARRLGGPDKPFAELPRSWRYRRQSALMKWMARRVANAEAVKQAEEEAGRIRIDGARWVQSAIEGVGVAAFNKIWQDTTYVPRQEEVTNVERWFSRVGL